MEVATARAAATIGAARRRLRRLAHIKPEHAPKNLIEAYAIQDQLVTMLGSKPIGWKIGCTNETAQIQLGVDEPFRGYVMADGVHQSPATLPASRNFMRVIETELAFRLADDLPLAGAPYSRADIEPAVAELIPSVEIVDSVWRDWEKVGVQHLIADNACHAGLVLGAASENWRDLDLAELGVSVRLNDEPMLTGRGGNALGHPFNALAWLANDLISMGRHLKAGDIVSTGVLTGLIYAQAGDHIRADYGRFGSIELNFTDN
jgi:2-keto-4-pentenoate hydratase